MEISIQGKNNKLGKMVSTCQTADVMVTRTDLFEMDNHQRPTNIKCLDGVLWITQDNDMQDYFIKKGQTFSAAHTGKVIVQGLPLGKARVSVL
jgi:Protein of unknown function (DUF2917)